MTRGDQRGPRARAPASCSPSACSPGRRARRASSARSSAAAPRARTSPARSSAAVRDRGADGVNLDFEPLARGYADEFVSLLRTIRSEFNRVRSGYQLTYDTTAYIGNYPLEASVGQRRRGRDLRHGLRLPDRQLVDRRAPSTRCRGPSYDLADTVRAYKRARRPARGSSSASRGTAAPGRRRPTARARATLSGAKYGYSRAVNYENVVGLRRASTAGAGTRSSRARTSSTAARTAPRPTAASPAGGRSGTRTRPR